MNRVRKWWKAALAIVIITVAAQVGVSLLVRSHRIHGYLIAQLERAFGRSVQVEHFNVQLLPTPRLDAARVTIEEDPAFGSEYFLRAEYLTAGLRWTGLLRGHFEFGTLSLSRPSLILVRNHDGRWNLERWLPPAKVPGGAVGPVYGPPPAIAPTNRLRKIDFDDGRINFKIQNEKGAFAFTGVSGSVEQVSPGRWQLQLEAQPWRSGVGLQSSGTVIVSGDLAGTSARLQPAEIHVHWEEVSLADLFRLFRGRDYGVRGKFSLDGTAKSGGAAGAAASQKPAGEWSFAMQARAAEIHRWDLSERPDNPRVDVKVQGHWNVLSANVTAEQVIVETLKSNLRGSALVSNSPSSSFEVRFDQAGLQASDALAWYRAFHPGVDAGVSAEQFFTGTLRLRGWPLQLADTAFSSAGGEVRVPGLDAPVRIGAIEGGSKRASLVVEPFRISCRGADRFEDATAAESAAASRRAAAENTNQVNIGFAYDFEKQAGALRMEGHAESVDRVLKTASAFGHPLNHGWELTGAANAAMREEWNGVPVHGHWNGEITVTKGELHAAGLNQPLHMRDARLQWQDGVRTADLGEVDGFGAAWSGTVAEAAGTDADDNATWSFKLHADHLDATELDRWIGPRSRPNWLQRLLPSLWGGAAPSLAASELLRRVNAQGELRVDEFTMETLKLERVRLEGTLHDLHLDIRDSEAQWAGGKVHTAVRAEFSPRPTYDVSTEIDRVDLAQLPAALHVAERLGGTASGVLHLTTEGVGRDELLQKLAGHGEVHLRNIEFRGWDVGATVADGTPRAGVSRWPAGQSTFTVQDGTVVLDGLRLEASGQPALVKGSVTFGQQADLTVQTFSDGKRDRSASDSRYVLRIRGSLEAPRLAVEKPVARQPVN